MTNNDPIIVVTEEKKRRRGLIWVAAGTAALLMGGSTFALWSASDTFTGGTITAGDLNIENTVDTSFWDVSSDRVDAVETVPGTDGTQLGHLIEDVATWRIVPGDKLAATFQPTLTLDGDNLVARVGIDGLQNLENNAENISYSYEVYYGDAMLVQETELPTAADAPLFYLSAPATGQDAGAEDATNGILGRDATAVAGADAQTAVFGMPATTAALNVVIYATFDAATTDRVDTTVADALGDLTVSLSQVRDAGAQYATK